MREDEEVSFHQEVVQSWPPVILSSEIYLEVVFWWCFHPRCYVMKQQTKSAAPPLHIEMSYLFSNLGICSYCLRPARRDRSGADSVTSFWCRVWFGNIAWNWKVVFTTFFWLVRTLLQQNQTRLQKLSHNFWSRVWCCCAASVSTCAHCACLWIPETTAVDILSTHGAWWAAGCGWWEAPMIYTK